MKDFAEKLSVQSLRVSSQRYHRNDYEFTLGGKTYYMDAKFNQDKSFLTVVALDELKAANKKIAVLEAEIGRLTAQNLYKQII